MVDDFNRNIIFENIKKKRNLGKYKRQFEFWGRKADIVLKL